MTAHGRLIDDMPAGALIPGTVRVIDCVRDSKSEWAIPGQWHWQLADPQPFASPIPAKRQTRIVDLHRLARDQRAALIAEKP